VLEVSWSRIRWLVMGGGCLPEDRWLEVAGDRGCGRGRRLGDVVCAGRCRAWLGSGGREGTMVGDSLFLGDGFGWLI
jgi:hypothetical protein